MPFPFYCVSRYYERKYFANRRSVSHVGTHMSWLQQSAKPDSWKTCVWSGSSKYCHRRRGMTIVRVSAWFWVWLRHCVVIFFWSYGIIDCMHYIWKKSSAHALVGVTVSGVAIFISIDEQLQLNWGCYFHHENYAYLGIYIFLY